jgi:hypothetical protein
MIPDRPSGIALLPSTVAMLVCAGIAALFWRANRQAKSAVTATGRRFADLIELSSDWIWEINADLRVTYVSPNIQSVTGKPPDFYFDASGRFAGYRGVARDITRESLALSIGGRSIPEHPPLSIPAS